MKRETKILNLLLVPALIIIFTAGELYPVEGYWNFLLMVGFLLTFWSGIYAERLDKANEEAKNEKMGTD